MEVPGGRGGGRCRVESRKSGCFGYWTTAGKWQWGKEATRCICPLSRHLKAWMKRNKLQLIAFLNKGGIRVEAGGDSLERRHKGGGVLEHPTNNATLSHCQVNKGCNWYQHLEVLQFLLKPVPESWSGAKSIGKPAPQPALATSDLSRSWLLALNRISKLTVKEKKII